MIDNGLPEEELPAEEPYTEEYEEYPEAEYEEYAEGEYEEYAEGEYEEYAEKEYEEYEEEEAVEPEEAAPKKPKKNTGKSAGKKNGKKGKKKRPQEPAAEKKREKKRGWILPVVIVCSILVLLGAGLLTLGILVSNIETIYDGVSIMDVDLSGMTKEQAGEALLSVGRERYDGLSVEVSLPLDNELTVTGEEVELSYSAGNAAETAWKYGRSDGLIGNLITYAKAHYLGRTEFSCEDPLTVTINEEILRDIIHQKAQEIDEALLESGVEVDMEKEEIRIMKGATGLTIDEDALMDMVRTSLLTAGSEALVYEAVPETDEAYDFQSLYDEMYAEKIEAWLVYNPEFLPEADEEESTAAEVPAAEPPAEGEPPRASAVVKTAEELGYEIDFEGKKYAITESATGVWFDVDAANRAWSAAGYGEEVVVPIVVDRPAVSSEYLNDILFADELSKNWTMVRLWGNEYCGEVRTSLSGSSSNRISNVKKACDILNGMVLLPGEVFSYNDALGQRTEANGWLPAPAYANGEVRQEAGGGICQVSSTLYNAALYSNLEIVERECHQFQVGYLPWGMDATVSWGWPDLKFRNDQGYPIMIHAWVDEAKNQCCVQILGTDTEHVYVLMSFNNWEFFDSTGTYHDASGNPLSIGMEAATWRAIYHDGDDYATATPISKEYEVHSKYNYHTEDIEARNVPMAGAPEEG